MSARTVWKLLDVIILIVLVGMMAVWVLVIFYSDDKAIDVSEHAERHYQTLQHLRNSK